MPTYDESMLKEAIADDPLFRRALGFHPKVQGSQAQELSKNAAKCLHTDFKFSIYSVTAAKTGLSALEVQRLVDEELAE